MDANAEVVVLVPQERGRELLGELPSHVRVEVWDGTGTLPSSATTTQFWVPPFLSGADMARAYAELPDLQVVQLLSAGAENFVDGVPEGVTLCNARGAHTGPTAEWVVAAMLSSYRMFPRFHAAQLEGRWDYAVNEELAGRRVLIVGAGDIPDRVRRMLAGFDVDVELVGRTARDGVHGEDELPALLPDFDVVVVLVPLTDATRGMVDAAFLARMRDGALLVNAARGPVAVTNDLVAELASGRLRAALDVTDPEPLPEGHPLWTVPGLLLTPHIAGSVPGGTPRAYAVAREQLLRHLSGQELQNVVGEY
ncbi:MAG: 2-hydroxyacid dehydrogenase [Geodermatophilaceae bacterium]|nr:2-hydroxyacid dehydrogenase [Geodermatophilaceae bacterium]MDQ3464279.1 2-hydroxyacid dehydrogenase [Actinomycetota bacterium]